MQRWPQEVTKSYNWMQSALSVLSAVILITSTIVGPKQRCSFISISPWVMATNTLTTQILVSHPILQKKVGRLVGEIVDSVGDEPEITPRARK